MFSFKNDYVLNNGIAELSPLRLTHEQLLFPISNDPAIWEYFTENGYGAEHFSKYIRNALELRVIKRQYPFVIKDLRTGEYAGITRLYDVNGSLKNVKIGHTWIGKRFQGTGLNKACKYLLFEFLFEELGIERIGFGASAENRKSIRAMESVGCIQEGLLRNFLPKKDSVERIDVVLLSLLKGEWEKTVKTQLGQQLKQYI